MTTAVEEQKVLDRCRTIGSMSLASTGARDLVGGSYADWRVRCRSTADRWSRSGLNLRQSVLLGFQRDLITTAMRQRDDAPLVNGRRRAKESSPPPCVVLLLEADVGESCSWCAFTKVEV